MTYIVTPATPMAIILRDKRKWDFYEDFYEISPKHKFENSLQADEYPVKSKIINCRNRYFP